MSLVQGLSVLINEMSSVGIEVSSVHGVLISEVSSVEGFPDS